MGRVRLLSGFMAAVMAMTLLSSCSSGRKENNVVKEDDPWFDTTRFKVEMDIGKNDQSAQLICASDDRVFSVYCYSADAWGSVKAKIDTYDLNGNLLGRKDLNCDNDFFISTIYSLSPEPDGKKINAIVYANSRSEKGRQAFMTIDPETGLVSDMKDFYSGEAKRVKKSGYGTHLINSIGDYTVALLSGDYVNGSFEWQMLLFKDSEFVTECDLSQLNINYFVEGYSMDLTTGSLYSVGLENGEMISMEFDIENGRLKSKKPVADPGDEKINFAEYRATDKGDMCKIDSLGNIVKIDVNTMTPQTVIDTTWYVPFLYPSHMDDTYFESTILSCNENRTVIWDYESVDYGNFRTENDQYVRILKKADKNPNAGKKIIELALPPDSGVTTYLAKAIYEFNITDDEYIIRAWDKYKTGFSVGRTFGNVEESEQKIFKMIQDLKGDDAPDIAVGIQKNYAMRDDVFMDLSSFLDPEVMDKQYSNIIDAGRINGKLYFLPVTLEIEGLVTNVELLKDGAVGITFEEYDKLIEDQMNGFSPYDYPNSYVYNKRDFLLSCLDTKSAIEGETVEFGTDQFRKAAQYTKDNFEYDDIDSTPREYLDNWNRYRGECYYAKMDDYLDYVHSCFKSNGRYNIIGTPSVDAFGPRFKAIETISVSATTDVKEGCRKFLNYLFSGAAFKSEKYAFRQIVTNREIMNKNVEILTQINNEGYERYRMQIQTGSFIPAPGLDKAFGDKAATDEMRESFLDSLSTISTYYYEDYTIVQFALEELAPYYAGDRSLDDAIKYLNDRTYKYVKEM